LGSAKLIPSRPFRAQKEAPFSGAFTQQALFEV
jgi:hypothetical protein